MREMQGMVLNLGKFAYRIFYFGGGMCKDPISRVPEVKRHFN